MEEDMILEILSRARLEDVARCRLVSKNLNSTTYESWFRKALCERTKAISGFFVQGLDMRKYKFKFVSNNNLDSDINLSLDFLPCPLGTVKIAAATKQGCILKHPVVVAMTYLVSSGGRGDGKVVDLRWGREQLG
uniref:F-box domain-containing protein n=1 Tax=Fagus sylvatica TaxID=28930 RepID=A0A2N9IPG6_FAGSY